jgi:hypothetical protein
MLAVASSMRIESKRRRSRHHRLRRVVQYKYRLQQWQQGLLSRASLLLQQGRQPMGIVVMVDMVVMVVMVVVGIAEVVVVKVTARVVEVEVEGGTFLEGRRMAFHGQPLIGDGETASQRGSAAISRIAKLS